jgi:hypothetical protein
MPGGGDLMRYVSQVAMQLLAGVMQFGKCFLGGALVSGHEYADGHPDLPVHRGCAVRVHLVAKLLRDQGQRTVRGEDCPMAATVSSNAYGQVE